MWKFGNALKQGGNDFLEDDCMSQAAAIAFYTIFSLPPLLMMVFYLAELTPIPQHTIDRLLKTQLGVPMSESPLQQLEPPIAASERASLRAIAERTGEQSGVL